MNVAFVIGRFQPVHKGHLELLKACEGFDKVIIFFGSSNEERTVKNPLTFEERALLMSVTLEPSFNKKVVALPLPDTDSWHSWMGCLQDMLKQHTHEDDKVTFVGFNKDTDTTKMNQFVKDHNFDCISLELSEKTHFMNATDVRVKLADGTPPSEITELHVTTQKFITELNLQNVFIKET